MKPSFHLASKDPFRAPSRSRWRSLLGIFALSISLAPGVVSGQGIRDYKDVVPESAVTTKGLFDVHQAGGRTLFEIPKALFGRDLLWYVERGSVSATIPDGAGKAPASLMIRLERRGDQIVIRNFTVSLARRSGDQPLGSQSPDQELSAVARSVNESALATPIAILPVASVSPSGGVVVDVTDLFRQSLPELELSSVFFGGRVDPGRSYIDHVRAYPRNVMVDAFVTALSPGGTDTIAALLKHSWTLLPEKPLRPREFDNRVGIFNLSFEEYAEESNTGAIKKSYIRRYRLDKKDPSAAISEPVKPIVYYIGRTVPVKWRKYIQQGVEDWNVAFEAAGFKNAIIAKVAPTQAEDPNWDPSDTRHSVIRWIANPVVNAQGPNIADPRTGEILSSHILIWDDVLKIANSWYYNMCSAVDKRAQSLPLSDEITGRMLRYIVSHEVGHSIGLRHNHRASTAYTVAELRNPEFCKKYGSTASIMAYGRMNYVAQPGDGVEPESLMPKVGPYDLHAIRWAYAPLAQDKEAETLDNWAAMSLKDPRLAWCAEDATQLVDPRVLTQNIGKERVEATRLGLANLKIASANLVPAYSKGAKTFDSLNDRWMDLLAVRHDYLSSVLKEIGGREETRTDTGHEPQFKTVSADRQRIATRFILDEGLNWDPVFYSNGVLSNGVAGNVSFAMRAYQRLLMDGLFDSLRLSLVNDAKLDEGDEPIYSISEYMDEVVKGIFSELDGKNTPTLLRRALQRDFFNSVEQLYKVNPSLLADMYKELGAPLSILDGMTNSMGSDSRIALRVSLKGLESGLIAAVENSKDPLIASHWTECLSATRKLLAR